jgi:hypothetical protein
MTKVITQGRKDTDAYFRLSGVLTQILNQTPFLVFVIDGDTVDVHIVGSATALCDYPSNTQVMAQWRGEYRSDYFQFTVGDALNAIATNLEDG